MKKWICYNLLGANPDDIDSFSLFSSLAIIGFMFGGWFTLFVCIPVWWFFFH